MNILILGAGFGGLELATRLSGEMGDEAEIRVIDENPGFVFGFSKLDVMFGKQTADHVFHAYEAIDKPGVRFTQTTIRSIDPTEKAVVTDVGPVRGGCPWWSPSAPILIPSATPGLSRVGTRVLHGARRLRPP